MTPLIQSLELGKVPRVVGTIVTAEYLREWRASPRKLPCDLVELRVDGFGDLPGWVEIGQQIEDFETPVFATVRLAKEGGRWAGLDSDRWPMLENALRKLSGVDVELQSELVDLVVELAAELKKLCILSYHDFEKTPAPGSIREMLEKAHERGCIGKVAATVNTPDDLQNLQSLLGASWRLPVCVIGMGPLGRETRRSFPRLGSCFTYGYLDAPGAPGQFSAAELSEYFKTGQQQAL